MLDPLINYFMKSLHYTSDFPVIALFAGVVIYGCCSFVPKLWAAVSVAIIAIVVGYFPAFYFAPDIAFSLANMGLFGKQWLTNEDHARSIGIGSMIGIVLAIMLLYLLISTVVELIRRTDSVYMLKAKKEPSLKTYVRATSPMVAEYAKADLEYLRSKLDAADLNFIQNSFTSEQLVRNAIAWVLLGVPVRRAVKKAQLDSHSISAAA
ncbi:hypothetical protein [Cohnella sp. AR92]|uniref:hypothetical protein n=1 Tax=Cohnella sp. AR92 TaxID=648716 RepID=UPI000F8D8093|nr:hypothetical protein [Cohnella sp. AR92]RUS44985.1 hypothetical protein ELR57_22280 [Cohnella sp. AR92]